MQTKATPTTIYIIDDHSLLRAGFASSLGSEGFDVVGDSGDPLEAIGEVTAIRPDVVLLDISMPGLSGIDAIAKIHAGAPTARILMVSHHEGSRFVEQALRAGADGYLSKASEPAELTLAVRAVLRGDTYVSPKVSRGLLQARDRTSLVEDGSNGIVDTLTAREREVFQLVALGHTNKEVARDLGISLGTVKKHRENMQRKLRCNSAAGLARLAIREGLLDS